MVHPIPHDVSIDTELLFLTDIVPESHFFRFPSIANSFYFGLSFPIDLSDDEHYIKCSVTMPSDLSNATQRLKDALDEMNKRYTPFIYERDPIIFPNIHMNVAIRNVVGFFGPTQLAGFHSTFASYNPMVIVLTHAELDEIHLEQMFLPYGHDRFIRIDSLYNNEHNYITWRSRDVNIWIDREGNDYILKFNSKSVEPWQLSCIYEVDNEISGLLLWSYLDEFARLNFLPWQYIKGREEVINLSDEDQVNEEEEDDIQEGDEEEQVNLEEEEDGEEADDEDGEQFEEEEEGNSD